MTQTLRFLIPFILMACGMMHVHHACGSETGTLFDLNPDNGRGDVLTLGAVNWPIGSGEKFERAHAGWNVSLAPANSTGEKLTFAWWKAGYDSGATLASDGITSEQPGVAVRLRISGLQPGRHSLVTWHNALDEMPNHSAILVKAIHPSAASIPARCIASHRARKDDSANTSYVVYEVAADGIADILYQPEDPQERVIINGFCIDAPDPSTLPTELSPAGEDEHTTENPTLSWKPPHDRSGLSRSATSDRSDMQFYIYFGTNRERVYAAERTDPEFMAEQSQTSFQASAEDCLENYFWRVDTRFADGSVSRGNVSRFKVRELAFPAAEGYGRFAIGGRGGRVIEVTNLDDSGPGSLRAAVEAEGPRTVVFRVSGTISLKSKLIIRNPYLTVAGQTAPGDGICVRGYTFGCLGTHDVIMRHIRIRVGDESGETMDGTGFASTDHAIYDHCSISWSIDEAVSSRSAGNITLQRCIVAEALNIAHHRKYKPGTGHSFAGSISGNVGSFHHNLVAHCAGRNWSLAGGLTRGGEFAGRLDIRNNVVFNWHNRTNDGGVKALNLVGNVYIPGPATRVFHLLKPDVGSAADRQTYFVSGNRMEGKFDESGDNWRDAVTLAVDKTKPHEPIEQIEAAVRLSAPFCEPFVATHPASEVVDNVMNDVGANYAGHDAVDKRVLSDVRKRTTTAVGSRGVLPGIIDTQADVGGWPVLKSLPPPIDTDHDGLPDTWEVKHGLDPRRPDQNARLAGSRVTALEVYLAEAATGVHVEP